MIRYLARTLSLHLCGLCLVVAAAAIPARASASPIPDIIAISVGTTTGLYGVVAAIGAGSSSNASRAWQIHAHLAGSLNLTCGVGELVVGALNDGRGTFVGMGLVNLLVGATSIAMGVVNSHKLPVLQPMYREESNGGRTFGLQWTGSF